MSGIRHLYHIGILVGLLLPALYAGAADIQVDLNGKSLSFGQPPVLLNACTMVPLREIFEALGAQVAWDSQAMTITASKGSTRVQLGIGQMNAMVNKLAVTLDAPAILLDGHTLVPLRFVSEAFGAEVLWDDATRTVSIIADLAAGDAPPVVPTADVSNPAAVPAPAAAATPAAPVTAPAESPGRGGGSATMLLQAELDDLLGPIALYPDPLLAQILPASTFPDQLAAAAQLLPLRGGVMLIDQQEWDNSVKAVAYYPSLLNLLTSQPDWTTAIGQAYVTQADEVMTAIQLLRARALTLGYLVSNARQQVYLVDGQISIVPAHPQYLYLPRYDCGLVYQQPLQGDLSNAMLFGDGLLIGVWLNSDMDWRHHRVYYHGWQGAGWISQSRAQVNVADAHYVNEALVNKPITGNPSVLKVNIATFVHAIKTTGGVAMHSLPTMPHPIGGQPSGVHPGPIHPAGAKPTDLHVGNNHSGAARSPANPPDSDKANGADAGATHPTSATPQDAHAGDAHPGSAKAPANKSDTGKASA